jgi:hypothetical protein
MSGSIEADPDRLRSCAKRVEAAAAELREAHTVLDGSPLRPESFGELGGTLRAAETYGRAARALRERLGRAGDVLAASGDGLRGVADRYENLSAETALVIARLDRR